MRHAYAEQYTVGVSTNVQMNSTGDCPIVARIKLIADELGASQAEYSCISYGHAFTCSYFNALGSYCLTSTCETGTVRVYNAWQ